MDSLAGCQSSRVGPAIDHSPEGAGPVKTANTAKITSGHRSSPAAPASCSPKSNVEKQDQHVGLQTFNFLIYFSLILKQAFYLNHKRR